MWWMIQSMELLTVATDEDALWCTARFVFVLLPSYKVFNPYRTLFLLRSCRTLLLQCGLRNWKRCSEAWMVKHHSRQVASACIRQYTDMYIKLCQRQHRSAFMGTATENRQICLVQAWGSRTNHRLRYVLPFHCYCRVGTHHNSLPVQAGSEDSCRPFSIEDTAVKIGWLQMFVKIQAQSLQQNMHQSVRDGIGSQYQCDWVSPWLQEACQFAASPMGWLDLSTEGDSAKFQCCERCLGPCFMCYFTCCWTVYRTRKLWSDLLILSPTPCLPAWSWSPFATSMTPSTWTWIEIACRGCASRLRQL